MNRREALSGLSLITGGSLILPQILLSGCERSPHPFELFTWGDTEILNEIAEMILPATSEVGGAKSAQVGEFVQLYTTDCLDLEIQEAFLKGYAEFKLNIEEKYGDSFDQLAESDKFEVIQSLEEAKDIVITLENGKQAPHFYSTLKRITNFGYFTSEVGATKALRYLPIPGSQQGITPYNGEKAWAM